MSEKLVQVETSPGVIEEVIPQVTVDEVTKQLLEQQQNQRPEDLAAYMFKMYFPVYKNLLGGLSNKDARRVAEHVVQWPLEDQNPRFNDEKAKQAFQVGIRLLDAKMIMRAAVEAERMQAIQDKQEAENKQKTSGVPAEGTGNG